MRILVVDDSAGVRTRLVAMLLEVPGVETSEAAGAEEAMATIIRSQPHLVVLDLHMPGRSGLELLPEIKRLPLAPRVVILTSHPTEHHRRLCVAQGADLFLDKARDFARVIELARLGEE